MTDSLTLSVRDRVLSKKETACQLARLTNESIAHFLGVYPQLRSSNLPLLQLLNRREGVENQGLALFLRRRFSWLSATDISISRMRMRTAVDGVQADPKLAMEAVVHMLDIVEEHLAELIRLPMDAFTLAAKNLHPFAAHQLEKYLERQHQLGARGGLSTRLRLLEKLWEQRCCSEGYGETVAKYRSWKICFVAESFNNCCLGLPVADGGKTLEILALFLDHREAIELGEN